MAFRNYACWNASDAAAILRTEALEGSRAIFKAVHSPLQGFEVGGVSAGLLSSTTETGLLDALTGPDHRHLFCVVEGEPGSGKSHLIRWLEFEWPTRRPTDLVLPVPRSNGSLEGVLREMRTGLPEAYRGLFAGLAKVQDTTLEGRARDFHSKLANSLNADYFVGEPAVHSEWAAKFQLSRLVGYHLVVGEWSAPRRILQTLSGGSDRNSRVERFSIGDVLELAHLMRKVRDRSIGPKAMQARRKFEKEADQLASLMTEGLSEGELEVEASRAAPMLSRLRESLDARFNAVVQDLVGVGRDGLTRAFRALRTELAKEGRRLVLLLEDITSFQGVDGQLLDVLVAKSATEEGGRLCDLLSVVGITTNFFNQAMKSYGNLRERIALHIKLGDGTQAGPDIGLSLATRDGRLRFTEGYLRAIRAGVGTINEWADVGGALMNRCVGCKHREPCHAAFGSTDGGVGLYPLSPTAIDRIFDSLFDPQGTMGLRTPRGMVQHVLSPVLLHPEKLEQGEYPPAGLEGEYLPPEEGNLFGPASKIPEHVGDPADRKRMRRLIAWWASRNPGAQTERDLNGGLRFAGIPQEMYEAFGLPWLGEGDAPIVDSPPPPPPPLPEESKDTPTDASEEEPETDREGGGGTRPPPRSPPEKAPRTTAKVKVKRGKLEGLRSELQTWVEGGRSRQGEDWSRLLMEILDGLPWQAMAVPHWVRKTLFTKSSVALEGTRKTDQRHFVVPRESWVRDGLDAWIALKSRDDGDAEYYRRQVARFIRRLKRLVLARVDERMLRLGGGEVWNPAASAAQILLARAWLRGHVAIDASPALQWEAIFESDPSTPLTSAGRSGPWQEFVKRAGAYQTRLQDLLREWIRLTVGSDGDDRGIVDGGAVASTFVAMVRRIEPIVPPASPELPSALAVWSIAADMGQLVSRVLPKLPDRELKQIRRTIERIEAATGQRSLPQYLREVGAVVEQLHREDAATPQHVLDRWFKVLRALQERAMHAEGPVLEALDQFLFDTDRAVLSELEAGDPARKLAWIVGAPAAELEQLEQRVVSASEVVTELWKYADTLLDEAAEGGTDVVEDLMVVGRGLRSAAATACKNLESEEGL